MYILSFFFAPKLRAVIGIGAIICFALLVGLSATVVRASIMAGLLLVAQSIGRTYNILRALLLAGAVMIFLNPYLLLYDIGFQLSFMATLGLVLIAPTFEALIAKSPAKIHLKEYLIATIATQIAVLPLLLFYMGEVSLVAIIVNMLVLPMVPFAMLFTFATGVIALLSTTLAIPVAFLAHLTLSYILFMATWFAKLPFASVTISYFPLPFVFILYSLIAVGTWWFLRKPLVKNEFADWVIEEEKETAGKESGSLPAVSETPVSSRRLETTSQLMFLKNASTYFPLSADL
jgi:competence protein ComEC